MLQSVPGSRATDAVARRITVTRPSLPFCLGAREVALGLASPLAGRDDAVEAAADCVQKRLVAERAADQLGLRDYGDTPVFTLLPRHPRGRPWACVPACGARRRG